MNGTVTAGDRLSLTIFLSVALHAIVILGVVFVAPGALKKPALPTLEVVLAQEDSKHAPKEADFLAETNQVGGGNVRERVRPSSPPPTPAPLASPGRGDVDSLPKPAPALQMSAPEVITSDAAEAPTTAAGRAQREPDAERPAAAELVMRSEQIARLSAEIDQSLQAYSRRPRERVITSQTKSYRDAAYMEAWREKIERIGNLNYPEEARRENLSGSLVLDVALRADGSLHSVELRHSSGHKVLDDAAIRIVKLAAPFAPFSMDMRKDTDILHITRAWQFLSGNRFTSGQ